MTVHRQRFFWIRLGLLLIIYVTVFQFFYQMQVTVGVKYFRDLYMDGTEWYKLVSSSVFYGAILLSFVLVAWLLRFRQSLLQGHLWKQKMRINHFVRGVFAGLSCMLLFFVFALFFDQEVRLYVFTLDDLLVSLVLIAATQLVAALVEEWVFRGYLFSIFQEKLPTVWSILITSLVFSFFHKYTDILSWSVLLRFLLGIVFCLWVLRSGSLWVAIGFHWIWNTLAVLLFEKGANRPPLLLGETDITWIPVLVLVLYIALYVLNRELQEGNYAKQT